MSSLLFGIAVAAVLSSTSLLIVLLRVSPLTSPGTAITSFFISLLLSVSTVATLVFYALWSHMTFHTWDAGKTMSISLRQGIFLGVATGLVLLFHLMQLLTWWIVLLIYAMFLLVEMALHQ